VSAQGQSALGVRVTSSFAWRPLVNPLPGAAQLTRRTESGLFGNTFHVEPRLAKQLLGIGDAQTVAVFGNAHADVLVKEARKMTVAHAREACERPQTPRLRK